MSTRILDAAVRAAFEAATSHTGKLDAVRAAFAANVTLRIEGAGGQHLRTMTLGPFSIVPVGDDLGLGCGAVIADTAIAPSTPGASGITPTRWEFRNGSTPIFDTESLTQGPIRALCRPTFGAVVFTVDPGLPINDVIAWSTASSDPGSLVGGVWTPGRDARGIVTQASVNLLPLNEMVRVEGTSLQVLRNMIEATGYNYATDNWSNPKDIRQVFVSFSGLANDGRRLANYAGGGHSNDSMNAVLAFDAMKMAWEILDVPSRPNAPGAEWSPNYDIPPNGTFTNYTTTGGFGVDADGIYQDRLPDGRPTSRHNYMGTVWDTTRNQIIETRISKWTFDVATKTHTRQRWTVDGAAPQALQINHTLLYHAGTDSIWGMFDPSEGGNGLFGQCPLPGSNVISRTPCPNWGRGGGTLCVTPIDADRALYLWFTGNSTERWGIHNMATNTWEPGSGGVITNSQTLSGFVFDNELQAGLYIPTWGAQGQVIRRGSTGIVRGVWWLFDVATKTNNLSWTPAGVAMPSFVSSPSNKYQRLDALGIALFLDDVRAAGSSLADVPLTSWYAMRYQ